MSKLRHDQKRDANEPEIVEVLEAIGCSVDRMPGGDGRMDLLVGDEATGLDYKFEVKMPGETLNPKQKLYHANWKGAKIHVIFSAQQAIEIVAWYRNLHRSRRRKA